MLEMIHFAASRCRFGASLRLRAPRCQDRLTLTNELLHSLWRRLGVADPLRKRPKTAGLGLHLQAPPDRKLVQGRAVQ